MALKKCPSCEKKGLETVTETVSFPVGKKTIVVESLTHQKCESCGERVFSMEAQKKIEATAYGKKSSRAA